MKVNLTVMYSARHSLRAGPNLNADAIGRRCADNGFSKTILVPLNISFKHIREALDHAFDKVPNGWIDYHPSLTRGAIVKFVR